MGPHSGWRLVHGNRYLRVRTGGGERATIPLSGCATKPDAEADARALLVVAAVEQLVVLGVVAVRVKALVTPLARAVSPAELAEARAALARAVAEGERPRHLTVSQFAARWTSGELAKLFPDHVKAIDQGDNITRFDLHILPHVGHRAIGDLTLADGDKVMAHLPPTFESRRAVAQTLYRLARLAVFPGRVLARSPFPVGWLPKVARQKAKPYLYPDEEAKLLGCRAVPLERRVAYGLLCREGMRPGELVGRRGKRGKPGHPPMEWTDVDLERGVVRLDRNKTDDPRAWALDPGTVRALLRWRACAGVFAFMHGAMIVGRMPRLAEQLREDLRTAGIDRPELEERSAERARVVAHSLRGTFVTISLANGRTETWVCDRTGHKSSTMVARYKRTARTAGELGLGGLHAMDAAIPELSDAGAPGQSRGAPEAKTG